MTPQTIDKLAGAMIDVIKRVVEPLKTEISALRHEVGELKTRPMLKWAGPHSDGVRYKESSLVTKAGSLWVATAETTEAPGSSTCWRLIVKRGAYDTR